MENNDKSEKFHIICEDYCSIMVFERDQYKDIQVAVFHNTGKPSQMSFKDKIRWIWQIITKGYLWNDFTVIGKMTARDLKDWL